MAGVLSKGVRLDFYPVDSQKFITPTRNEEPTNTTLFDWCLNTFDNTSTDISGVEKERWAIGIYNLQEVPELGQSENASSKEQVDVTVLSDSKKQYIDGLEDSNNADSDSLSFKFIYDNDVFNALMDQIDYLKDLATNETTPLMFRVCFPSAGNNGKLYEGDLCAMFKGVPSLSMDSVSVNSPLTFTLKVAIKSEVEFKTLKASVTATSYAMIGKKSST